MTCAMAIPNFHKFVLDLPLVLLLIVYSVNECNPYPCLIKAKCESANNVPLNSTKSVELTESLSSVPALPDQQQHQHHHLTQIDISKKKLQSNFTEAIRPSTASSSFLSSPSSHFPLLPHQRNAPVSSASAIRSVPFSEPTLDKGQAVSDRRSSNFGNSEETGSNSNSNSNLVLKLDREYSPQEIAEYIYSTGDENGISQIVYEMVQDGQIMSSPDDVIRFFEVVQSSLAKMREKLD